MIRLGRLSLVLILAGACRESTEPMPVPVSAIVGTWGLMRAANDPPGSSDVITLHILPALPPGPGPGNAQLQGEGNWAGEAGPSGTSTAVGWLKSDSLTLDITYTYSAQFGGGTSRIVHFEGRLTDANTFSGVATFDSATPATVTYKKFGPD